MAVLPGGVSHASVQTWARISVKLPSGPDSGCWLPPDNPLTRTPGPVNLAAFLFPETLARRPLVGPAGRALRPVDCIP